MDFACMFLQLGSSRCAGWRMLWAECDNRADTTFQQPLTAASLLVTLEGFHPHLSMQWKQCKQCQGGLK